MRYVSDKVISFSIRVDGREDSVRVKFIARSTGGSTFSTQAEDLIKALEKSEMYGKVYRRAPECTCGKKAARQTASSRKVTIIPGIVSWQDAIEYLVERCGSDASVLVTPEKILAEAAKNGVKFPDIAMKYN